MSNVSYYAIKTIFFNKIKAFFSEFQYSIISPLISIFLFFTIIIIINDHYVFISKDNNYIDFVVPGFLMILVMQASYHNISENLITMKQIGSFNDYLISPISRIEILIALILSNVFMSLFLALTCVIIFSSIVEINSINYFLFFYYLIVVSLIFSCIGSIVGFLFFTWDVQQAISSFFIIPISLLSGTFFSINSVNSELVFLFKFNPFFLIVNKFRESFNGIITFNFETELSIFIFTSFFLFISLFIFKKGYKVIQ